MCAHVCGCYQLHLQPEFDDTYSCKRMCGQYCATFGWACGLCSIWQDRWADGHVIVPVNTMAPPPGGPSGQSLDRKDQSLIQGDAHDGEGIVRSLG